MHGYLLGDLITDIFKGPLHRLCCWISGNDGDFIDYRCWASRAASRIFYRAIWAFNRSPKSYHINVKALQIPETALGCEDDG